MKSNLQTIIDSILVFSYNSSQLLVNSILLVICASRIVMKNQGFVINDKKKLLEDVAASTASSTVY